MPVPRPNIIAIIPIYTLHLLQPHQSVHKLLFGDFSSQNKAFLRIASGRQADTEKARNPFIHQQKSPRMLIFRGFKESALEGI